jgi:hypothetical protein
LRQNDFGGVLGGPIKRGKLFFFGSYEALRVRQPQVADTYVPSLASRQNAPTAVQPLLRAFPSPNGPDLGKGTAAFSASYSDPSTLNSYGIRIDYRPWQRVTIFGRYSDAPSSLDQRAGSYIYSNIASNCEYTVPDPKPDPGEQSGDYPPMDQRAPLQLQPEPGEQLPNAR